MKSTAKNYKSITVRLYPSKSQEDKLNLILDLTKDYNNTLIRTFKERRRNIERSPLDIKLKPRLVPNKISLSYVNTEYLKEYPVFEIAGTINIKETANNVLDGFLKYYSHTPHFKVSPPVIKKSSYSYNTRLSKRKHLVVTNANSKYLQISLPSLGLVSCTNNSRLAKLPGKAYFCTVYKNRLNHFYLAINVPGEVTSTKKCLPGTSLSTLSKSNKVATVVLGVNPMAKVYVNQQCVKTYYRRSSKYNSQTQQYKHQLVKFRKSGSSSHSKHQIKRYQETLRLYNKYCLKEIHSKQDYLHKVSKEISQTYDVVIINRPYMTHSDTKKIPSRLTVARKQTGINMLIKYLEYKMSSSHKILLKVTYKDISKWSCSVCGFNSQYNLMLEPKELIQITSWVCPHCGTRLDVKDNLAANMLKYVNKTIS